MLKINEVAELENQEAESSSLPLASDGWSAKRRSNSIKKWEKNSEFCFYVQLCPFLLYVSFSVKVVLAR